MDKVVVYCTATCPYCIRAQQLLDAKAIQYELIRVDLAPDAYQEMLDRSDRSSVPQIFVGEHHIGGYDDLSALEQTGKLDALLGIV